MTPPPRAGVKGSITATTDFHSTLGRAPDLAAALHRARSTSLIVDSGDFFEGSHYPVTRGTVEQRILTELYDVIAPGNHGWPHYTTPPLRDLTVCANVIDPHTGELFFRPLHLAELSGRTIAITAVIGPNAFTSIAPDLRSGQAVTDPASALQLLYDRHRRDVDDWVLLSHQGYQRDRELASRCTFLNLVLAGHCHSSHTGPEAAGTAILMKAPEFGRGTATAHLHRGRWTASVEPAAPLPLPAELSWLATSVGEAEAALDEVAIRPSRYWRGRTPTAQEILRRVAAGLRQQTGLGVILNTSALNSRPIGDTLTHREVGALVPYDNRLLHTGPSPALGPRSILDLEERFGPLVIDAPARNAPLITTDYLAQQLTAIRPHTVTLRHAVLSELTSRGRW
ncbi:metallophosphoesterase [Streptomyces sp. NBC_01244]|uniref:metallophosphoesterase n=1 Tax=Streptomyces sp. NBC_01244 TaxID=2903797 RepID=UPI002E10F9B0|nr:bifunctional metallophosphatase/5'-nucleotidase [Streptomyces sp. NBC_01244]